MIVPYSERQTRPRSATLCVRKPIPTGHPAHGDWPGAAWSCDPARQTPAARCFDPRYPDAIAKEGQNPPGGDIGTYLLYIMCIIGT